MKKRTYLIICLCMIALLAGGIFAYKKFFGMSHIGFDDSFNGKLMNYIIDNWYEKENFMVSPLSLKAALALLVFWAEWETKEQLLKAMDFKNEEEMLVRYDSVKRAEIIPEDDTSDNESSEDIRNIYYTEPKDTAYSIANSIWHNKAWDWEFKEEYIDLVKWRLNAELWEGINEELLLKINSWVSEKTQWLIKEIIEKIDSSTPAILINAIYLKSSRYDEFKELWNRDFTTIDWKIEQKEMMERTSHFGYYEDSNTQLVSVPMRWNINMAFILWNAGNINNKLQNLTHEYDVDVIIPKIEIENSFDKGELVDYLTEEWVVDCFWSTANLSKMYKNSINKRYVWDIIQKTKLKLDEKGVEAAAVTAIVMESNWMYGVKEEPKKKLFKADKPFSFIIYQGGENPEIIFQWQYVK